MSLGHVAQSLSHDDAADSAADVSHQNDRKMKMKFEHDTKFTAVQHLWRELGHTYGALMGVKKDDTTKERAAAMPRLAAQALVDGELLELINGETGYPDLLYWHAIIKELDEMLTAQDGRAPKICVISIVGVQSCGKSTLLNKMFGCTFFTGTGQCTRGANVYLVPVPPDERMDRKYDYLVVVDMEGICNPLYSKEKWYNYHNNRLATFAVLCADLCMLLNNNEDDVQLRKLLPLIMTVYNDARRGLEKGGHSERRLVVVYNRIETSKTEQLDRYRGNFCKMIVDAAKELRCQPLAVGEKDFFYLPTMDATDLYGLHVRELRAGIERRLAKTSETSNGKQGLPFKPKTLSMWWKLVEEVMKCLDSASFVSSFEDVQQYRQAEARRVRMISAKEELEVLWAKAFQSIKSDYYREGISAQNQSEDQALNRKLKRQLDHNFGGFKTTARLRHNLSIFFDASNLQKQYKEACLMDFDLAATAVKNRYEHQVDDFVKTESYKRVAGEYQAEFTAALRRKLDGPDGDILKENHVGDECKLEQQMRTRNKIFEETFQRKLSEIEKATRGDRLDVRREVQQIFHRIVPYLEHGAPGKRKLATKKEGFKMFLYGAIKGLQRFFTGYNHNHLTAEQQENISHQQSLFAQECKAIFLPIQNNEWPRKNRGSGGQFQHKLVSTAATRIGGFCYTDDTKHSDGQRSTSAACFKDFHNESGGYKFRDIDLSERLETGRMLRDEIANELAEQSKTWHSENSKAAHFKKQKETLRTNFIAECDRVSVEERCFRVVCAKLLDLQETYFHDQVVQTIKDDMNNKVPDLAWTADADQEGGSRVWQAHMNLHILDMFEQGHIKRAIDLCQHFDEREQRTLMQQLYEGYALRKFREEKTEFASGFKQLVQGILRSLLNDTHDGTPRFDFEETGNGRGSLWVSAWVTQQRSRWPAFAHTLAELWMELKHVFEEIDNMQEDSLSYPSKSSSASVGKTAISFRRVTTKLLKWVGGWTYDTRAISGGSGEQTFNVIIKWARPAPT